MPTITVNPYPLSASADLSTGCRPSRSRLPARWRRFAQSTPRDPEPNTVRLSTKGRAARARRRNTLLFSALSRLALTENSERTPRKPRFSPEPAALQALFPTTTTPSETQATPQENTSRLPGHLLQERERRAFPRRESGCIVAVCLLSPEEALTPQQISWQLHAGRLTGRMVDVSMNGIALELPYSLEANTRLHMRISNRQLLQNLDISGSVLRSTAHGEGVWNVICQLDRKLTFEQIHTIGKHLFASTIV